LLEAAVIILLMLRVDLKCQKKGQQSTEG